MAGWVGTFWDLKHVGVTPDLDAILAQDREGNLFSHPPTLDTLCGPYRVWGSCRDTIHIPMKGWYDKFIKDDLPSWSVCVYHDLNPVLFHSTAFTCPCLLKRGRSSV